MNIYFDSRKQVIIFLVCMFLTLALSGCISSENDDECYGIANQQYCHSLPTYPVTTHYGNITDMNQSYYSILEFSINSHTSRIVVPYLMFGTYDGETPEVSFLDLLNNKLDFYLEYNCVEHKRANGNGDWVSDNKYGEVLLVSGLYGGTSNSVWLLTSRLGMNYQIPISDCDFIVKLYDRDIRNFLSLDNESEYSLNWVIKIEYYGDPKFAVCPDDFPYMAVDFTKPESPHQRGLSITDSKICHSDGKPQINSGEYMHRYSQHV